MKLKISDANLFSKLESENQDSGILREKSFTLDEVCDIYYQSKYNYPYSSSGELLPVGSLSG